MTTSGSIDFNLNRSEIINHAFLLTQRFGIGEEPDPNIVAQANTTLNLMVKTWQAQGVHLWKQKEGIIFPEVGKQRYLLGSSGDRASSAVVESQILSDVSSGATQIQVSSASNISDQDNIGILKNDNSLFWTTVNGDPVGDLVDLTDALDGDVSEGNNVFSYNTLINRPLRILNMRRSSSQDTDIEVLPISRDEYFTLNLKSTQSVPNQYYYNPSLGDGELYVWPTFSDQSTIIRFTFMDPLEDFDVASNTPDFPQEWLECLAYGLAFRLSGIFGLDSARKMELKQFSDELLAQMKLFDADLDDVNFYVGDNYGVRSSWPG